MLKGGSSAKITNLFLKITIHNINQYVNLFHVT